MTSQYYRNFSFEVEIIITIRFKPEVPKPCDSVS